MKKKYIAPCITVMNIKTPEICINSRNTFHVNHGSVHDNTFQGSKKDDWGFIITDPGKDKWEDEYHGKKDPWDSDNW